MMRQKRKSLFVLLALLTIFSFSTKAYADDDDDVQWTNVGTAQDFYDAINKNHSANVRLVNDINLASLSADDDYLFNFAFSGRIDGDNHEHSLRDYSLRGWKHMLFNELNGANISHVCIMGCEYEGHDTGSGQLAIKATNTTLDDVVFSNNTATGDATGYDCDRMGAAVGIAQNCTFKDLMFLDCKICSDGSYLGAVAGEAKGCTFTNCVTNAGCEFFADGNVTSDNSAYEGGLCGYADGCSFTKCFNFATVLSDDDCIGGIIGYGTNNTTLTDCKNGGAIRHCTKDGYGRAQFPDAAASLSIAGASFTAAAGLSYLMLYANAYNWYNVIGAGTGQWCTDGSYLYRLLVAGGIKFVNPVLNFADVLSVGAGAAMTVTCMPYVFLGVAGACFVAAGSLAIYDIAANPDELGGIAGTVKSGCVLLRCTNAGPLECSDDYCGGIVGYLDDCTINSCYNRSYVRGNGDHVGGIVGYCNDGIIMNNLNVGPTTTNGNYLGNIEGLAEGNWISSNNYYLSDENKDNYTPAKSTAFTQEKLPSGEIAMKLNSLFTQPIWRQNLGTDFYPVLDDDTTKAFVTKTTSEYSLEQNIYTAGEFYLSVANPKAQISLQNDIDLGSFYFNLSSQKYPFQGVIKGNNHTLSNCSYEMSEEHQDHNYALFPYVNKAEFDDLILDNINITQANEIDGNINTVGILAGTSTNSTYYNVRLKNCSITKNDDNDYLARVGGIVAHSYDDGFQFCTVESSCKFSGYTGWYGESVANIGGLCGIAEGSSYDYCCNYASIWSDDDYDGGLVGNAESCAFWGCLNAGTVVGQEFVAGIVGRAYKCSIVDCVNIGTISDDEGDEEEFRSGIVGSMTGSSTLARCMNFGTISDLSDDNCNDPIAGYCAGGVTKKDNYYYCKFDGSHKDNGTAVGIDYTKDILTGKYVYERNHNGEGWAIFYQSIDNYSYCTNLPVPVEEAGQVYSNVLCDADHTQTYSNTYQAAEGHTTQGFSGICSLCGNYSNAAENVKIGNADEFFTFAQAVNKGYDCSNTQVELTADIDFKDKYYAPIGDDIDHPFRGTFDGKSHRIKNVNLEKNSGYTGLFGCVTSPNESDYTYISRIVVDSTCIIKSTADYGTAALVGAIATPSGTSSKVNVDISACSNMATVIGKKNVAGLVGGVYNNDNIYVSIHDCCNIGNISGEAESAALIAYARKNFSIANCFNYGVVTGNDANHSVVRYNSNAKNAKFKNVYQLEGLAADDNVTTKTEFEFKNGSLCNELQEACEYIYEDNIWGENLGTDAYPNIMLDGIYHERKMTSHWGTVALPYEIWTVQDLQLYEIAGFDPYDETGNLRLKPVLRVNANTPCFFQKYDSDATTVRFSKGDSEFVSTGDDYAYLDTGETDWALFASYTEYPQMYGALYVADDKLWLADLKPVKLPAYRAVIISAGRGCKSFNIVVVDEDGEETNIGEIADDTNSLKDAPIYSITGQRLAEAQKGRVNIINGKKVFVK